MDYPQNSTTLPQRKLFAAAESLLLRHGYRKTSVEEICRRAGMSKRSFYELFRDKADLLLQLTLAVSENLVSSWKSNLTGYETARVRLDAFLDAYAELCRDRPVLQLVFSEPEILTANPGFVEKMMQSPLIAEMDELIEDGVRAGEFRAQIPSSSTLIIFALLDTTHILMPQLFGMPGPLEDEVMARQLRRFILSGLGVEMIHDAS